MSIVEAPTRQSVPAHDEELLIREARKRTRRRRWIIGLALVIVVASTLAIAGGGKGVPPTRSTSHSLAPTRSGVSSGHSAQTPSILGGQSVLSIWPVGGETTWVFTMNEMSSSNGAQGVDWTSNGGRTWRNATPAGYSVSHGTDVLGDFFALSATRAWVVVGSATLAQGPRPRLLATDNAGRTWSLAGTVPSASCTTIFSSPRDGICATSNGAGGSAPATVYSTSDGGATWRQTFDNSAGFAAPVAVHDVGLPYACDKQFSVTASNILWAEFWCNATSATLYRSFNNGHTWTPVTVTQPSPQLPGGAEFTGPIVLRGQRGAVALTEGQRSLVYVTRDGGRSFTPVYPPRPAHVWAIDIVTPRVWRLAYRDQLISTNDAGASWTGVSDNAFSTPAVRASQRFGSGAPASLTFTSATFGWMTWMTGNGSIVMRTRDDGLIWQRVAVPGTGSGTQAKH